MSFAPEGFFLQHLFEILNASSIRYAVMRNFENLPDNVKGGDLDIIIHPDDVEIAVELISLAIFQSGGAILGITRSPGFRQIMAFGQAPSSPPVWWGLCLDVFDEVLFMGAVSLLSDRIWEDGIVLRRDIKVLKSELAAVLGVVKEVLYNNKVPLRYRDAAIDAVNVHFVDISLWLAPLGVAGLNQLRDIILDDSFSIENTSRLRRLRRYIVFRSVCNNPLRHFRQSAAFYFSRVARIWNPAGKVVAVLGTDGVGKSTIISAIDPVLSAATHSSFLVKHLRPGLLPPLARIKGVQPKQSGPVTDPHQSVQSGFLGSLARIVYLMADYTLGYWFVVWPKIAKVPSAVVLFDRYAYDISIDPKRFRIDLPANLINWFSYFAPKPDIICCLYASPLVILDRKQELPMEEIERQVSSLKEFSGKESRAVLISSEGTVEETRDLVLVALRDFCARLNCISPLSE